jgi:hypothetical protein
MEGGPIAALRSHRQAGHRIHQPKR